MIRSAIGSPLESARGRKVSGVFVFGRGLRLGSDKSYLGIESILEAVQDDSVAYSGVIAGVSYLEGHQLAVGRDTGFEAFQPS